jgi:tetratricopeptide (TPR) repeat protein
MTWDDMMLYCISEGQKNVSKKDKRFWHSQGDFLFKLGRYDQALCSYQVEAEIEEGYDDRVSGYIDQLGMDLFKKNQFEVAARYFSRAMKLDENANKLGYSKTTANFPSILNSKGLLYFTRKQYKEALTLFQFLCTEEPKKACHWYNQGNVLRELQQYHEAANCYEQAFKLSPLDKYVNLQGHMLAELDQYEKALFCFRKASELEPTQAFYIYNEGCALASLGRYHEAAVCFSQAVKLDPTNRHYIGAKADLYNEYPHFKKGFEEKSQKTFGCDSESKINASRSLELGSRTETDSSIKNQTPSSQADTHPAHDTSANKNFKLIQAWKLNLSFAFSDIQGVLSSQKNQTPFDIRQKIANILETALIEISWNIDWADECLWRSFKLYKYPDVVLMLYNIIDEHNIQHNEEQPKDKILLNLNCGKSFEYAIEAYTYLNQTLKEEKALSMSTHSSSASKLINQNGIFKPKKISKKDAKKLLILIESKLKKVCECEQNWCWLVMYFKNIPKLPWKLCDLLLPYLIILRTDYSDNTILHHLVQHPECSAAKFEQVLKKFYEKISSEKNWISFLKHPNEDDVDALKLALSAGRTDLCNLLFQYSMKPKMLSASVSSLRVG